MFCLHIKCTLGDWHSVSFAILPDLCTNCVGKKVCSLHDFCCFSHVLRTTSHVQIYTDERETAAKAAAS